jgi:hypothetical protein
MLNYSRLEIFVREKHFSLLDPFISYEKWSVVNTHPVSQWPIEQTSFTSTKELKGRQRNRLRIAHLGANEHYAMHTCTPYLTCFIPALQCKNIYNC